jgi:hypothetical protein
VDGTAVDFVVHSLIVLFSQENVDNGRCPNAIFAPSLKEEISAETVPRSSMPHCVHSLRGIMMILSPAKTLDLSAWQPIGGSLVPTVADCSPSQTLEVAKAMKGRKESELGKLLGISANLAKTTSEGGAHFRFHVRLSFLCLSYPV